MEILRRYYAGCVERARGQADECVVRKLELVMQQAGVTPELCPAVGAALEKAAQTGKPAGAMVLPDSCVVTGKTSPLLGASAALLLNALKHMAGIDHKLDLIPSSVIEPISAMKTGYLGHHNPRLHSDEVLIALAISGLTCDVADFGGALPPELSCSWTPEQLDYIHDADWWHKVLQQSKGAEILAIREMECTEEAWADWLQCENEYAQGDRAAIEAGALDYLNSITIVLRKK